MSGIVSGSKCLVFEQCLGLLTAAVLDRLGGKGACIHLHRGEIAQSVPCVQSMDFTKEVALDPLSPSVRSISCLVNSCCFMAFQVYLAFYPLRISTLLKGHVCETSENQSKEEEVLDKFVSSIITCYCLDCLGFTFYFSLISHFFFSRL